MRSRTRNPFSTVKTAGLLLPIDLLARIADGDPSLLGLTSESYHLEASDRLNEAAARAWNECSAAWKRFRQELEKLPASDAGTTLTRERWLLPLFKELGYGRLQPQKAIPIEDKTYPISHAWGGHIPIHLVSSKLELDKRTPGAAGAAARSPYSLVQELLNRSAQHRWGFLSNGRMLYVLRDNVSLTRAANVEFDLEAMFDGDVFADFKLLFLLCHESRVEIPSDGKPEDCWLERWSAQADKQGVAAREKLRDGVESAIKALGAGFLTTKGNAVLRERLSSGELATQDYYRQLLRMVYRLLLLLVAEEKKDENGQNLLHPPGTSDEARKRYAQYYSVGRLRTLAGKRRGTTHTDLYESLKLLFLKLRTGYEPLGIPGLGSFLFSPTATPDLDAAPLTNEFLLDAIRAICITEDTSARGGAVRRPVDFANLGSDELGSVYESLLELHPKIDTDEGPFTLGVAAGHERKTTGSYYTPTSLINCLLDSALDPIAKEALNKPTPAEAEQALLNLKICDPACGSGHFLIAAAERLAKNLASLRTGDEEPSTLAVQHAKRDIIGRCIYGVDMNLMAVELCQVALWMEALDPGRPFSFLEHHIQCGNSLLGTTPALLRNGIPDDAFTAIEGDIKTRVSALKKQNKQERKDFAAGQGYLDYTPIDSGDLGAALARVDEASGETTAGIAEKERRYTEFVKGTNYQHQRLLADTWCAAFVWKKDDTDLGKHCPTEKDFRKVESHASTGLILHVRSEVERLRDQYQFFHWHLAFPDVFHLPGKDERPENDQTEWSGGFDVVLGNPPWETADLIEKEFFAALSPEIAEARTTDDRKRLIAALPTTAPELWKQWQEACRHQAGTNHFWGNSTRFPFGAVGRLNTYRLFAELGTDSIQVNGRYGLVLKSGIITGVDNQPYISALLRAGRVVAAIDFINTNLIFQDVVANERFCLLTVCGMNTNDQAARFAFTLVETKQLSDIHRFFSLTREELRLINPNDLSVPPAASAKDKTLLLALHARHRCAVVEDDNWNPWRVRYTQGHLNSSTGSEEFSEYTLESLTTNGASRIQSGCFQMGDKILVPYYEGKFIGQMNHRFGTFEGVSESRRFGVKAEPNDPSPQQLNDPFYEIEPRYWIPQTVAEDLYQRKQTPYSWLFAFRDVCRAVVDARTLQAAVIPRVPCNHKAPLFVFDSARTDAARAAIAFNLCWSTFVLDYALRQKIAGATLTKGIAYQLPMPSPEVLDGPFIDSTFWQFVLSRGLELTYVTWSLSELGEELGYAGPPFGWDEERRFLLRCEIDAAFFHLYLFSGECGKWRPAPNEKTEGLSSLQASFTTPRDAVSYIMDTFPIVRRKDEEKYNGDYRSKRVILEIYDSIQEAIRTGEPYQTRLDPPPGPPNRLLPEWKPGQQKPADWPSHIHPPRGCRATPSDEWRLSEMTDGATLPRSFKLMLQESEATGGIERSWKGKLIADADGLPEADSWVVIRHPDLKRGNTSVPVAMGKLTYQELTEASTKKKVMAVTLRGPVPPAQVRIPLEDWPSFRPLAVLEPLD